jgi:dihydroxyacetone kinase-like protein
MDSIAPREGKSIVDDLVRVIQANAASLSEIDGAIGDGDHGINMNKGFTLCAERLAGKSFDLAEGLSTLGSVLLNEIGGAMGPLYGTFFREMAKASKGREQIDSVAFGAMLEGAIAGVTAIGGARVGDKTLLDTLVPAREAYAAALRSGKSFHDALGELKEAAEKGKESTRGMVAKIGRASRLGERSRGVLDAGASSCCLILTSMAQSMQGLLAPHDRKAAT